MLIAIDANEANVENRVGIGQFAYAILKELPKLASLNKDVIHLYLKDYPGKFLPEANDYWQYQVFGPKFLWTQTALPFRLFAASQKPRVFYSLSHYAPRFSPVPTVVSIMDLSFIHFPHFFTQKDLFQLKNWTAYSVKKAVKIITISEYSKKDIAGYYLISPDKIEVVYPGYDRKIYNNQPADKNRKNRLFKSLGIKNDFILFTGTIQPRKNIERLIEAYKLVRREKTLQLVLVGKKGWQYQPILDKIAKEGKQNIIWTDYLANEELSVLYKNARCFILPSFYEGFGIPVIEAMASGCPAVVSNNSSLPEIAGEAAIRIDPDNPESIAEAILEAGYNKRRREQMIKNGLKNIKRFDWAKSAVKIYQILRKTGGE